MCARLKSLLRKRKPPSPFNFFSMIPLPVPYCIVWVLQTCVAKDSAWNSMRNFYHTHYGIQFVSRINLMWWFSVLLRDCSPSTISTISQARPSSEQQHKSVCFFETHEEGKERNGNKNAYFKLTCTHTLSITTLRTPFSFNNNNNNWWKFQWRNFKIKIRQEDSLTLVALSLSCVCLSLDWNGDCVKC